MRSRKVSCKTGVVKGYFRLLRRRRTCCGLTVLSKVTGASRSTPDDAWWKEKGGGRLGEMRGEKYNKMDRSHFGQKVLRTKEMPNKNDAYDSPASARSSARSRSASTMANLRATCINDIHIRFLTCAAFHHLPPPLPPRRLWKLRRRRDGKTPTSRRRRRRCCHRRRSRDWKSYDLHGDFSLLMRSKSADELSRRFIRWHLRLTREYAKLSSREKKKESWQKIWALIDRENLF